jgi:hypothetical protein
MKKWTSNKLLVRVNYTSKHCLILIVMSTFVSACSTVWRKKNFQQVIIYRTASQIYWLPKPVCLQSNHFSSVKQRKNNVSFSLDFGWTTNIYSCRALSGSWNALFDCLVKYSNIQYDIHRHIRWQCLHVNTQMISLINTIKRNWMNFISTQNNDHVHNVRSCENESFKWRTWMFCESSVTNESIFSFPKRTIS